MKLGVSQETAEAACHGPMMVDRRVDWRPGNLDIIPSSPSSDRHSPSCSCGSLGHSEECPTFFYLKINSDPEVEVSCTCDELFIWLLAAFFFFFSAFLRYVSDSVHSDVESQLSFEFLASPRWPTVVGHRGLMPLGSFGSVDKHIALSVILVPAQIQAHFIPSGTRPAQEYPDKCFLHDANMFVQQGMRHRPRTQALKASQGRVYRESHLNE